MKLNWLKINRYPLVKPGCHLIFNDDFNVILGLNGTGKTTLLELISRIARWDFSDLKEVEFDLEYSISKDDWTIEVRFINQRLTEPIEVEGIVASKLPDSVKVYAFDARLDMQITSPKHQSRSISLADGPDTARMRGRPAQSPRQQVELFSDFGGPHGLISHVGYEVLNPYDDLPLSVRIDESHEWLESMLVEAVFDDYPGRNIGIGGAFIMNLRDAKFGPISPRFNENIHPEITAGLSEPPPRVCVTSADQTSFLLRFLDLTGLKGGTISWELVDSERIDYFDVPRYSFDYRNPKFYFTRKDDSSFQHSRLSFGQKRLLMLLWYLNINPGIAIIDELTNGLHKRMLEHVLDALSKRQSFLATQSPLLVDSLDFDSVDDIQRGFIMCSLEKGAKHEWFAWEQISKLEAGKVHGDLETRCLHVNEILSSRGLW